MYKDRGLIKWLPFDALSGFFKLIDEIKINKNKNMMPILSDDDYELMEYNFKKAIFENKNTWLIYYQDGYFFEIVEKIGKIDYLNKTITLLNNLKLKIKNIYKLEIY